MLPAPSSYPPGAEMDEAKGTTILSLQKRDHKHSKSDKIKMTKKYVTQKQDI